MGIDAFAFLKKISYGCIIYDLSTHQPIDMLKNQDQQTVTRDGSLTFRRVIQEANSDIVQILDRFHIIQSLVRSIIACSNGDRFRISTSSTRSSNTNKKTTKKLADK